MLKLLEQSPACFAKRLAIKHHDRISWLIPDRYFVFSAPGGKIHLNIKESSMMLSRALGLYEPEKTRAVQALLKLGETFVDVGGNKGDFALLAAKITGENGKVVCIELCNLALSDHDGESLLHLGTKSGFHTLMSGAPDRDRGSLKVIVRKLDSLLPELQVGAVNALKIDVEGAELQVLKGAAETIAANPQIVLFLDIHPFLGVNPSEVFDYLGFLGLTVCEMRQLYNLPATPHEGIFDIVARRLGALDNRQLSKSDYTH